MMAKQNPKVRKMLKAMTGAARVASVMVDGDEAGRVPTERALHYVANPDPNYRSLAGDYYDVDHLTFQRMKKLLFRIERLVDFTCNASLWLRTKGKEGHMSLVLHNGSVHRYYTFGASRIEVPEEMARCMETGEVVVAPLYHESKTLTVLARVADSLGDVVGVVELSAMHPKAKSIPPAWA